MRIEGFRPGAPSLSAVFADRMGARVEDCRRLKPARDSIARLTQDLCPGLMLFRPPGSGVERAVGSSTRASSVA